MSERKWAFATLRPKRMDVVVSSKQLLETLSGVSMSGVGKLIIEWLKNYTDNGRRCDGKLHVYRANYASRPIVWGADQKKKKKKMHKLYDTRPKNECMCTLASRRKPTQKNQELPRAQQAQLSVSEGCFVSSLTPCCLAGGGSMVASFCARAKNMSLTPSPVFADVSKK